MFDSIRSRLRRLPRANLDLRRDENGSNAARETLWGITVGMVVIAYFATPMLRYVDPAAALPLAAFGAIVVASFHWVHLYRGAVMAASIPLFLAGMVGVLVTLPKVLDPARIAQKANDRRCLAIQRDMLSSRPLRADGPDLFQALGCRPQGEGSIHAAPRVKKGSE